MKFAERRQAISDSFRRTLLALPEVSETESRQDSQQRRLPNAECRWLSFLMRATEELNLAQEKSPLNQWPESHLVTLHDSLRVFVELNHKLEELL